MIARGLALLAGLRPDRVERTDREHEAERIAERLRGLGYEVVYGFDADIGDYAEARVDGRVVARAARCGSVADCLRQVAGELGVELPWMGL